MGAQTHGLVKSVVSRKISDPIARKTLAPPPMEKFHYTTLSVKKKIYFRILGFTDDRNLKLTICFFSDLLG